MNALLILGVAWCVLSFPLGVIVGMAVRVGGGNE